VRRVLHLAAPASTATLALVGAAWAATGDLPLVGPRGHAALEVSAQATGPLVVNDRDGQAILTAGALRPGVPATGEVTIGNGGDAAGAFTLSSGGLTDGPGALSSLLDLTVRDVTAAPGATLYAGKLSAFSPLPLGMFAAGASRRYRFEVAYPAGRAAVADNALQGATTAVAFNWDTVAVGGPATTTPTTPRPPVLTPPAPVTPAAPATAATTAAPATTPAIPATPGPAAAGRPTLALGTPKKAVAGGRLVTWMTSTTPARVNVAGTVTVSRKRYKLTALTVALSTKRKPVRLRLPPQAAGRRKALTVRLTLTTGTGSAKVTLARTLRVRTP
jgi:hypothetical protein